MVKQLTLSDLTPDDIRQYFRHRLGRDLPARLQTDVLCPFHSDGKASMSLNTEHGRWFCHTCNEGGVIIDFEKKFSRCSGAEGLANISQVIGQLVLPVNASSLGSLEAKYVYTDAQQKELFTVSRWRRQDGTKTFTQAHRGPDGWINNIDGVERALYNLYNVVRSGEIFIVEGEKSVERLAKENLVATCNPGGAGKWLDEYSPYLLGKKVIIIADNDDPGRAHAQKAATAVSPFAYGVKVINLPVKEKGGDVVDYLADHSVDELMQLVKKSPVFKIPERIAAMFISAREFIVTVPDQINWLVEGLIQKGANGFFVGNPKSGKSWAVIDLCLALATGMPWMGFTVPRRIRTALISREDTPALTAYRMSRLLAGRGGQVEELDDWLYVNSRAQMKSLMIDQREFQDELIYNIKRLGAEICFLDVFNVLHSADENDNTEMRQVLNAVTRIQAETGCALWLIHHWAKGREGDSITQRLRGASAIAGFAEGVIGIEVVDRAAFPPIRKLTADLKAAEAPLPVYYKILSSGTESAMKIITDYVEVAKPQGFFAVK